MGRTTNGLGYYTYALSSAHSHMRVLIPVFPAQAQSCSHRTSRSYPSATVRRGLTNSSETRPRWWWMWWRFSPCLVKYLHRSISFLFFSFWKGGMAICPQSNQLMHVKKKRKKTIFHLCYCTTGISLFQCLR